MLLTLMNWILCQYCAYLQICNSYSTKDTTWKLEYCDLNCIDVRNHSWCYSMSKAWTIVSSPFTWAPPNIVISKSWTCVHSQWFCTGTSMFSCCKHVCAPEFPILNIWDILKASMLTCSCLIKVLLDKQFQHLKSFTTLLNVLGSPKGDQNKQVSLQSLRAKHQLQGPSNTYNW